MKGNGTMGGKWWEEFWENDMERKIKSDGKVNRQVKWWHVVVNVYVTQA